jgi:UV DNA damage repair endonuclease
MLRIWEFRIDKHLQLNARGIKKMRVSSDIVPLMPNPEPGITQEAIKETKV